MVTTIVEKNEPSGDSRNSNKAKVMSKAFKAVEHFFHEPSKTYIYFCRGLSHLGAKGVGAFPNESYESFQNNLKKMVEPATESQLLSWNKTLEAGVKKVEMDLKLKYLTVNEKGNSAMKVSVDSRFVCIKEVPMNKKIFLNTFVRIVDDFWDQFPLDISNKHLFFEKELYSSSKLKYNSNNRINLSLPNKTIAKIKVIATEINVKNTQLTKAIANKAAQSKELV
jgi:hypothetical protein